MLVVNEREQGVVVALYLAIEPLETCSGLEPVSRYEPNMSQYFRIICVCMHVCVCMLVCEYVCDRMHAGMSFQGI